MVTNISNKECSNVKVTNVLPDGMEWKEAQYWRVDEQNPVPIKNQPANNQYPPNDENITLEPNEIFKVKITITVTKAGDFVMKQVLYVTSGRLQLRVTWFIQKQLSLKTLLLLRRM